MKKNKEIQLMESTFFEGSDSKNSKYISKKEKLNNVEEELKKEIKKERLKLLFGSFLGGIFAIILCILSSYLGSLILDVKASFINKFIVGFLSYSSALGSFFGTVFLSAKESKRYKYLENKKRELEEEIKEDELKEKVKSLSKDNRKVLQKVIKNPEVKDVLVDLFKEYENIEDSFIKNVEKAIYFDADDIEKNNEKESSVSSLSIGSKKNN